jgi:hypothetical protein
VKNGNLTSPRKAVLNELSQTNIPINGSIFFYILLCINHGQSQSFGGGSVWLCCVATYSIGNLGVGGDFLAFKVV